ncbi:MAG: hypothetical protein VW362_07585 [Candidatus Nanopelagicales bacterium]
MDPTTIADALADCAEDLSAPDHGATMDSRGRAQEARVLAIIHADHPPANACEECGNNALEREEAYTARDYLAKRCDALERWARDVYDHHRLKLTDEQRRHAHSLLELGLPPRGVA